MKRKTRQFVFGLAVPIPLLDFTSLFWLQVVSPMQLDDRMTSLVGVVPWLSLDRFPPPSTPFIVNARSTWNWQIHPVGIVINLLLLAVLAIVGFQIWKWLVSATAAQGDCDACGYNLARLKSEKCPECGAIVPIAGSTTGAPNYARLMTIAIVLLGIGSLGGLASGVLSFIREIQVFTQFSKAPLTIVALPPWMFELNSIFWVIKFSATLLLAIWFTVRRGAERIRSMP